jgi:DNA-binding SARP family transcriptional activator/TolB-like protein
MRDSRDPHAGKPLRLLTLGRAVLVDPTGVPLVGQPRRIALLTLVAAAGERGISRDKLIAYLSPERPTDAARHSLHQLLYYLRQQGGGAIFLGSDPLRTNPSLLTHDVALFDQAFDAGAFDQAVGLYHGPFLDGFHLSEAWEFDEWASGERTRLTNRYRSALLALARAARQCGDLDAASRWSHRLSVSDPLSVPAVLEAMRTMAALQDRSGAVRVAQEFQQRLHAEFGALPDAEVDALAASIRSARESPAPPRIALVAAPVAVTDAPETVITDAQPSAVTDVRAIAAAPCDEPLGVSSRAPEPGPRTANVPSFLTPRRWVAALAVLVATTVLVTLRLAAPASAHDAADARVLAILPTENIAGDSVGYLAQGIENTVHDALFGLPALRVVPASVMQQFPPSSRGERSTAQRVGAGTLLRSRLVLEQDTLRWVAEFIDQNGRPIRSGRFTISAERIATLGADIMDTVAAAMHMARATLRSPDRRDGEAQLLVMRAEHFILNRDAKSLRRAQLLLNEAIERDPLYADAYSRLAGVYSILGMSGAVPVSQAYELANAAARRALTLDPAQSMAIASLAYEQSVRLWQWEAGEQRIRRALELEPWRPTTWNMLGTTLRMRGRFDEAREAIEHARRLDPLARHYPYQIGRVFRCAGQLDSSLVWLRQALVISPTYATAHELIAEVQAKRGLPDSAIAHYREMATSNRDSATARLLNDAKGQAGLERFLADWARQMLQDAAAAHDDRQVNKVILATLHAMLGDSARALGILELAAAERDPTLPTIACGTAFERLRQTPRFTALLQRMNLTTSSYGRR